MEASSVRRPLGARDVSGFGDSVFRSQVLMTGCIATILCITLRLSADDPTNSATLFIGITTVLGASIIAAVTPWPRLPHDWQIVVPILDIVAIIMLRLSAPDSGFSVLLAFPVIWMATSFGLMGTYAGPALTSLGLWSVVGLGELDALPDSIAPLSPTAALSLSLTLAFLAIVAHSTDSRVKSQRVLLRRQTAMLEAALERARVQEIVIREALDAVEFAVMTIDLDGAIISSNRATGALLTRLGLPTDTPWTSFPLYRADRATPLQPAELPDRRAVRGEAVDGVMLWIGQPGGTRFAIDVDARLLVGDAGDPDRVVVVMRDITTETEAIAARDDLVTSMSHELRTPLSSILGYVDLALEDDGVPAPTRDMLEIALSNTTRLMSLVNDMLLARSTSRATAISLRLRPCDVCDVVRDSIDAVRPLAIDRIITVSLQAPDHVPATADPSRLRQVIDNVISNAIKYNHIGGRIDVIVETTDDQVSITVQDSGRGMTPSEQEGLFERFYRAESVRGSTIHGSGLGLNISRDIVQLHGGSITVESESGRGTSVAITIPLTASPVPSSLADAPQEN